MRPFTALSPSDEYIRGLLLHRRSTRIDKGNTLTGHVDVAPGTITKLRAICLELPEAFEERAWVGTRWMIRKKNFAHVLAVEAGWPPAYARAAGCDGPITVLTFRSGARLGAPRFSRPPFFKPVWWPNIAGLVIDARTDWDEVADQIAASYCLLAPKKLASLIDRPA